MFKTLNRRILAGICSLILIVPSVVLPIVLINNNSLANIDGTYNKNGFMLSLNGHSFDLRDPQLASLLASELRGPLLDLIESEDIGGILELLQGELGGLLGNLDTSSLTGGLDDLVDQLLRNLVNSDQANNLGEMFNDFLLGFLRPDMINRVDVDGMLRTALVDLINRGISGEALQQSLSDILRQIQSANLNIDAMVRFELTNLIARYTSILGTQFTNFLNQLAETHFGIDAFVIDLVMDMLSPEFLLSLEAFQMPNSFRGSLIQILINNDLVNVNQTMLETIMGFLPEEFLDMNLEKFIDAIGLDLTVLMLSMLPEDADIVYLASLTGDEQFAVLLSSLLINLVGNDDDNDDMVFSFELAEGSNLWINADLSEILGALPRIITMPHLRPLRGDALFRGVMRELLFVIISDYSFWHLLNNNQFYWFMFENMPAQGGFLGWLMNIFVWDADIVNGISNAFNAEINTKVITSQVLDLWMQSPEFTNWENDIAMYLSGERTRPSPSPQHGFWRLAVNWNYWRPNQGIAQIRQHYMYHWIRAGDISAWNTRINNELPASMRFQAINFTHMFNRIAGITTQQFWNDHAWHLVDRGWLSVTVPVRGPLFGTILFHQTEEVGPIFDVLFEAITDMMPELFAEQGIALTLNDVRGMVDMLANLYASLADELPNVFHHLARGELSDLTDAEVIVSLLNAVSPSLLAILNNNLIMGLIEDIMPPIILEALPEPFDSEAFVNLVFGFIVDDFANFLSMMLNSNDIATDLYTFLTPLILTVLSDDELVQVGVNIATYFIPYPFDNQEVVTLLAGVLRNSIPKMLASDCVITTVFDLVIPQVLGILEEEVAFQYITTVLLPELVFPLLPQSFHHLFTEEILRDLYSEVLALMPILLATDNFSDMLISQMTMRLPRLIDRELREAIVAQIIIDLPTFFPAPTLPPEPPIDPDQPVDPGPGEPDPGEPDANLGEDLTAFLLHIVAHVGPLLIDEELLEFTIAQVLLNLDTLAGIPALREMAVDFAYSEIQELFRQLDELMNGTTASSLLNDLLAGMNIDDPLVNAVMAQLLRQIDVDRAFDFVTGEVRHLFTEDNIGNLFDIALSLIAKADGAETLDEVISSLLKQLAPNASGIIDSLASQLTNIINNEKYYAAIFNFIVTQGSIFISDPDILSALYALLSDQLMSFVATLTPEQIISLLPLGDLDPIHVLMLESGLELLDIQELFAVAYNALDTGETLTKVIGTVATFIANADLQGFDELLEVVLDVTLYHLEKGVLSSAIDNLIERVNALILCDQFYHLVIGTVITRLAVFLEEPVIREYLIELATSELASLIALQQESLALLLAGNVQTLLDGFTLDNPVLDALIREALAEINVIGLLDTAFNEIFAKVIAQVSNPQHLNTAITYLTSLVQSNEITGFNSIIHAVVTDVADYLEKSQIVVRLTNTVVSQVQRIVDKRLYTQFYPVIIGGVAELLNNSQVQVFLTNAIAENSDEIINLIRGQELNLMVTGLLSDIDTGDALLNELLESVLKAIDTEEIIDELLDELFAYFATVLGNREFVSFVVAQIAQDLSDLRHLTSLDAIASGLIESVINVVYQTKILDDIIKVVFDTVSAQLGNIIKSDQFATIIGMALNFVNLDYILDDFMSILGLLTITINNDRFRIGGIDTMISAIIDTFELEEVSGFDGIISLLTGLVTFDKTLNSGSNYDITLFLGSGNIRRPLIPIFMGLLRPLLDPAASTLLNNLEIDFSFCVTSNQITMQAGINLTSLDQLTNLLNIDLGFNLDLDLSVGVGLIFSQG